MKKLIDAIKKALGMDKKSSDSSKGFTLIELLVVIAVIGVLAAAILVAIDPLDRLAAAKDSRVQQDIASIANGIEQFAVVSATNAYPAALTDLTTNGQLKNLPTHPNGGNYNYAGAATGVVSGALTSKKYTSAGTPVWKYTPATGRSCAAAAVAGNC